MAEMTNEYSNFPIDVINLATFQDVTDTLGAVIAQIDTYRANGQIAKANELIESYGAELQNITITSNTINQLFEEIRNTQIYARDKKQYIYYDLIQPSSPKEGDVWIGGELS